jgi:integrase/recombinase XerD
LERTEKIVQRLNISVRLQLQRDILAYVGAAGIGGDAKDRPSFRSTVRKTTQLTGNGLNSNGICELVKRRLKAAALPERQSPRSFRVTAITDLLTQGVPLEDVQCLAGYSDPRTTRIDDRRQRKVTRIIVERISI